MRIKPIQLQETNQLVQDYLNQDNDIQSYFDYLPFEAGKERLADLQKRSFQREALVDTLHKLNADWDAPQETFEQIERLRNANSVVVIGGQQAGLMTGPMYTLNKVISILALAEEKEKQLNIPVIPVFWIAGEDHDYDEINHIYSSKDTKLYKHTSPQQLYLKKSISSVRIEKEKTAEWIKHAFHDLRETEHTKFLYECIQLCLQKSTSYVDFFARLIFMLFPNQGIVLIDSAHPDVRKLERKAFKQLIYRQSEISSSVYNAVQKLQQKGYALSLEAEIDDAHLFYHDTNNERILLKREGDLWVGKNEELVLTTDQLIQTAEEEPERLSNNVVTRPIMQETLFPTLAFVGGDGEISYWAALRGAFRAYDENLHVPPVFPRLKFTYITNRIEKLLKTRVLEPEHVLEHGVDDVKINWLMTQETPPVETVFDSVKGKVDKLHFPLQQLAETISPDLANEARKNIRLIQNQLAYLENKTKLKLEERYELELEQYTEIGNQLKPNQLLQERVWSPLPFINEYGIEFINKLLEKELSFHENHYLVYLNSYL